MSDLEAAARDGLSAIRLATAGLRRQLDESYGPYFVPMRAREALRRSKSRLRVIGRAAAWRGVTLRAAADLIAEAEAAAWPPSDARADAQAALRLLGRAAARLREYL